jgi:hypothetical protein
VAIDEMFWYKSIILLVDAHKLDYHKDKDAYDKSAKILKKAIDLVRSETPQRSNKRWDLAYVEAMLVYALAELTCEGLLTDRLSEGQFSVKQSPGGKRFTLRNSMHHALFKKLSEVCDVNKKKNNNL